MINKTMVVFVFIAFVLLEFIAYFRFSKIGLPEIGLFVFVGVVGLVLLHKMVKTMREDE